MKKLLLTLLLFSVSIPTYAHENNQGKENFKRAFEEGTINLVSPQVFDKDMFYVLFSHNYFLNSFPRGSNPAFQFSYVPIDNLQIDSILSLRQSPLEFELGIKYAIFDEFKGSPLSLAPRVSYNTRGNILGLDISASKIFFNDILQIGLGYRLLNYFGDSKLDNLNTNLVQGLGINTILRVWKQWYLFADAVLPFNSNLLNNNGFIWSTGLKKRIPDSPHVLTLYVGNVNENTISGRTVSTGNGKYPDMLKVGFLFSIGIEEVSKLPSKLF
jgi:hypothetical protein